MMQLLLARKVPLWMGATLGGLAIRFGALWDNVGFMQEIP